MLHKDKTYFENEKTSRPKSEYLNSFCNGTFKHVILIRQM